MADTISSYLADDHRRLEDALQLPLAAKPRLDHGALAALLVLTPTNSIIAAIRAILAAHNPIEEGPDGVGHSIGGHVIGGEAHTKKGSCETNCGRTAICPVRPFFVVGHNSAFGTKK